MTASLFGAPPGTGRRRTRLPGLLGLLWLLVSASAADLRDDPEARFLDNGQIRVGVKPSSGAGIAWISASGSDRNRINSWDRGRLIQQSYYGKPDGSLWDTKPWVWNPVQGGDWKGRGASVLELRSTRDTLYSKSLARHWASGEELTHVVFEQWITLTQAVAHVRFRMTYSGSEEHPEKDQELPAIFVAPDLDTLVVYSGDRPWTGGELHRTKPGWPNEYLGMTESWAAYIGADGRGLGAYVPSATRLTCYRFGDGREDHGSCSYFAPLLRFPVKPGLVFEYDVFLTLGDIPEMRSRFGELHRRRERPPGSPAK